MTNFLAMGSHDPGYGAAFNMTKLALQLSGQANGVSALHGEVSRKMWQGLWPDKKVEDVPIGHVTNGVHLVVLDRRCHAPALSAVRQPGLAQAPR